MRAERYAMRAERYAKRLSASEASGAMLCEQVCYLASKPLAYHTSSHTRGMLSIGTPRAPPCSLQALLGAPHSDTRIGRSRYTH